MKYRDFYRDIVNENFQHELEMGKKEEMEHTDDPKIAEKIALDHLREDPMYYTKLKKCMKN